MNKNRLKRLTIISAFISFLAFAYKISLSVMTMSLVLMIASMSTLLVFICKMIFIRNIYGKRVDKKKAYFWMSVSALLYVLIFILFITLKVAGIDISNKTEYPLPLAISLVSILVVMFILSLFGLKSSLERTDIIVIGLKEMTFIGALADIVFIYELILQLVKKLENQELLKIFTGSILSYTCSAAMIIVVLMMFRRFFKYDANKK